MCDCASDETVSADDNGGEPIGHRAIGMSLALRGRIDGLEADLLGACLALRGRIDGLEADLLGAYKLILFVSIGLLCVALCVDARG